MGLYMRAATISFHALDTPMVDLWRSYLGTDDLVSLMNAVRALSFPLSPCPEMIVHKRDAAYP